MVSITLHRVAVLRVTTRLRPNKWFRPCRTLCASSSAGSGDRPLRIGFIGAGGINFGTEEGPWNHSVRLEKIPGVEFSGVVDINTDLARQRVEEHRGGPHPEAWQDTQVFSDYHDLLDSASKPDAVFIGLPPKYHGSLEDPSANIELQMARAGVHLFVEKPLSIRPADEVLALSRELEALQREKGLIIGVGYMLRYSPAVEAMKRKLEEHGARPAAVIARYNCAYTYIRKQDWWDMALSGGPIVEQATHFVDLMRFLGGEIEEDSIRAIAVGPSYPLEDMPAAPDAEHEVPEERRINRATSAMFHFEGGAIGSLTHTAVLHENRYFTAIEVLADGLHIVLEDPYGSPELTFRAPHSNDYQQLAFDTSQDMFTKEAEAFVAAVRAADASKIRSTYADAVRSYAATQWITRESLKDRR